MTQTNQQRRVFHRMFATVGLVLAIAGSARAQAIGQIFGKATDESGGVMPGVTVTVAGTGLQKPLTAVTTSTGAYSFTSVPIGTYSVTFELSGFKKAVRPNVVLTTGFSAMIDQKMEVGALTTEVTVTSAPPVVDTKRTATGATFGNEVLDNVPTARDPFQIINMAPGVTMSNINVGGSASGQQLTPTVYGSSSNVQWNIEGGNATDVASNGSALYYNFDSFQEIQVVTGGGDVSVQSSGLFINLVTKSGSNVFKGSGTTTFENAKMQGQNVTESLFKSGGSNGTGLSGNPLHKIANYSGEFGGPIIRNRLWFWGAADKQDINVGILNFFDTSNPACNPPPSTFAQLEQVQGCLKNDRTLIEDLNGKINYQLNSANRFQFLFTTDNKVRNARSASANTAPEATYQQYSPNGILADFTPQFTHTLVLSDKLVFTNQATHVGNIFSLDFQDWARCGQTKPGVVVKDPTCLYNIQPLRNRTTGYFSRGPGSTPGVISYFERPTWEVKTDGTYFLSNFLGGDHQLKFGVGWHEARSLSYSHYGGGTTNAYMQCVGNVVAGCGDMQPAAVGSATGLVPFQGIANRDTLSNVDWWNWSSYIQDSYSKGRFRFNGGVRQDYQNSKLLGGCVDANVIVPNLLPAQCQDPGDPHHSFNNISPRGSAVYDLFGNGKTALSISGSYYFDTRNAQAGSLNNLSAVSLTWGSNQSSGACSTTAGASCWNDANHDGFVQANELIGTPTSSSSRFDPATGILTNVVPSVDPNLKIGRTREVVAGIDRELLPQLHARFEFVYRNYDLGSQSFIIGYQPGQPGFGAPSLFTDRQVYVDPISGKSAPYYTVCQGCVVPTGTTISTTSPNYQIYKGINVTVEKRLSHRWFMQSAFTYNINRNYSALSSYQTPTGFEFSNGVLSGARYVLKMTGNVNLPFGLQSGAVLQVQDGSVRNLSINGPGQVYGGVSSSGTLTPITLNTLTFETQGQHHLPVIKDLDANLAKTVNLPGKKQQIRLTLDCFNIFNAATIRSYSSNNIDSVSFNQVTGILAPRIFRVLAKLTF